MPYELRNQPIFIENVIVHLGVEVRVARLARYESQSRLSTRCGVSQSTWSMVENGLAEGIRLETLARIAGVLQLDLVLRPCPILLTQGGIRRMVGHADWPEPPACPARLTWNQVPTGIPDAVGRRLCAAIRDDESSSSDNHRGPIAVG